MKLMIKWISLLIPPNIFVECPTPDSMEGQGLSLADEEDAI
jgi:hypothetical protein